MQRTLKPEQPMPRTARIYELCAATVLLLALSNVLAAVHPTATVAAPRDSIVAFFGTDSVKLVFVDRDTLYYVDFAEQSPTIRSMSPVQRRSHRVSPIRMIPRRSSGWKMISRARISPERYLV